MKDLSLHVLDIAENAVMAGATRIEIGIKQNVATDRLEISVSDNGSGMGPDELSRSIDPFYTTRSTRKVGLGLSMFHQAAREAGGGMDVSSRPGSGTVVRAWFVWSHVDRKPLGDLAGAIIALVASASGVDMVFDCVTDRSCFSLRTAELRKQLEEVPISHPEVLALIRRRLEEGCIFPE